MDLSKEVRHTIEVLNSGGVIIYPTDTIWGIGCDPFNANAVEQVFETKKRDRSKPLLLLVDSIKMLKKYAYVHPRVETLLVYHKRPLTLIHKAKPSLPQHLLPENGTIGIRIVREIFCSSLIAGIGKPICSSSANTANKPFPASYAHIENAILKKVDYVVNYGREDTEKKNPSVIASYNEEGDLVFLR